LLRSGCCARISRRTRKVLFCAERPAPQNDLPADASPSGIYCLREAYSWCCSVPHGCYYARRRSLSSRALDYSILLKSAVERQLRAPRLFERTPEYRPLQGDQGGKNRRALSHHRVRPSFHAAGFFSTLCEPSREVEAALGAHALLGSVASAHCACCLR